MKFLRHYHYWPIKDEPVLPNLRELEAVASFAARCVRDGHRVLTHCTAGYNRSGLVNAVVLCQLLHVNGKTALDIVRAARPGAVYNPVFEKYLLERR
jgi:protein-tyrosine phosphatase